MLRVALHSSRREVRPCALPKPMIYSEGRTKRRERSGYEFPRVASKSRVAGNLTPRKGYTSELAEIEQGRSEPEPPQRKDGSEPLRRASAATRRTGIGLQGESAAPTGAARLASSISQQLHRASAGRRNDRGQYERPWSSRSFTDRTCGPLCSEFMCNGVGEPQCQ